MEYLSTNVSSSGKMEFIYNNNELTLIMIDYLYVINECCASPYIAKVGYVVEKDYFICLLVIWTDMRKQMNFFRSL